MSDGRESKAQEIRRAPASEFLLYESEDGVTRVECRFGADSLWLSRRSLAELFQVTVPTVSEHLDSLYESGELAPEETIRKFRLVQQEGERQVARIVEHYSLDAILAVGYRVRSPRGAQFRRWASEKLREYLVKGFALNEERPGSLPARGLLVADYFDELLERIRDIRASERRMYLRVTEIFALAADYEPSGVASSTFFRTVQNKLHYAATGLTAAEIVGSRADHQKPNMGLTSWQGATVRKADVLVAKNYLTADEIAGLNRIVLKWLDFAEERTLHRQQVLLEDWIRILDDFLHASEREVFGDAPDNAARERANRHATAEYEQFDARRRMLLEAEGRRRQLAERIRAARSSAREQDDV
jgi:hypothetical protein